jgi:glycerophosphoryl diester phosphodiesterase
VAHRGGSKLAPENTLDAFRQAVELWGADMLETDVRLTRDGQVVVIHDATVDRTTNGSGAVATYTLEKLRELDAGYRFTDLAGQPTFRGRGVRIPTLDELLEAFPDFRINIEAKEPQVAEPLVRVIHRHGAESRVLVAAAHERYRASVRGYPGPWGASRHQVILFWLLHSLPGGGPYTPPVDVLQVPEHWRGFRIVTPAFIEAAHRRNIPVQVWTVDEVEDMKRLLEWGIDGIQSDRPDLLADVLTDFAGRPPAPARMGGEQG